MKRFFSLLLALLLCTSCAAGETVYQKYSYRFWGTFDTLITLTGYTQDAETFEVYAQQAVNEMTRYHMIFDQYNPYDGVDNLYAVNQSAGQGPTPADPVLIELLLKVQAWREAYSVLTDPSMGSVLRLWHDARTLKTQPPALDVLQAANDHVGYDQIIIDAEACTIAFADPEMSIDLGAVAKGYAAQLLAESLSAAGLQSFLLNAGGNVICGPAPLDGRTDWSVAIEDLDGVSIKLILSLKNTAVVTSGDYQRYYEFDGQRYHHLIDPSTLYPAMHMRAVSIIHPDSGLADFLSTAAFMLPYEHSRALIESIPEAEGMWTLYDGTIHQTEGFAKLVN